MSTDRRTPVCRVRSIEPFERKHVARDERARYWVRCRLCPAENVLDRMFGGDHTLGWVPDLQTAVRFADAHAAIHLAKTCPTCHHTPEVAVNRADTEALMTARSTR